MLSHWSGWGALGKVFDPNDTTVDEQRERLHVLLDDAAWSAAAHSTLNAHFTDPAITTAMWDLVTSTGFAGGRILEPGCGTGLFIGTAPDTIVERCEFVGVELEPVTAQVAALLYPDAEIRNVGFETVRDSDGSFDAAIGNVPFGNYQLFDPLHNADRLSIHNHFLAKSLALTKPGGIVAMVTSRYTLDARNPAARRVLHSYGDLLAAIRLPSGAHQRLAGTQAVTDVLVFQRRNTNNDAPCRFDWESTEIIDVDGGEVRTNTVFTPSHRGVVIGTVRSGRGMYANDELIVDRSDDWVAQLVAATTTLAPQLAGTYDPVPPNPTPPPVADIGVRCLQPGELYLSDTATLMQWHPHGAVAVAANTKTATRQLVRLVELRDTARAVMELQSHGHTPGAVIAWETERGRLNDLYDDYRRIHHSALNAFALGATGRRSPVTPARFRNDPGWAIVSALEVFDDTTQTATKAAIFQQWLVTPERTHHGAETLPEALAASLAKHRAVDVEFIAELLATEPATVRDELADANLAYVDPASGDLVAAQMYLSGNVRTKLRDARSAAATNAGLQANVDALEQVLPQWLAAEVITARLGAVWIDAATIAEFLVDTFDAPASVTVEHAALVGTWTVKVGYGARSSVAAATEWGTAHADAYRLVDDALNLRPTIITSTDADGKTIRLDDETMEANDKRRVIEDHFCEWVWQDPDRAARLEAVFNERFNSTVLTYWDGGHLDGNLAGLSATFIPHRHQLDAVWRIMGTDTSTLLPHRVGAGKTAAMVIAGRQLKRTGQITKPLYVVPNHMLEQFSREFAQLYPTAKILVATNNDLAATARRTFAARCATGDWDGVVMTQSAFGKIATSIDTQTEFITAELTRYDQAAHAARNDGHTCAAKEIEKAKARLNTALSKLLDTTTDAGTITFEDLGVDYIFVDESHAYKGLAYVTRLPIAASSSKRATDMVMKLDWLRSCYGPKVATFATGTPIANSLAEMWVLKRFLVPDLLDAAEMTSFDSWAGTFARSVTKMELAPEGGRFRISTRIAAFDNVPELLTMFRSFADFLDDEALASLKVPDLVGGAPETVLVASTPELAELISSLGERADAIRSGPRTNDAARVDNMLMVCNDGRLGSLDLRLIDRTQPAGTGKVDHVADRVAALHERYRGTVYLDSTGTASAKLGALQAVFCDKGTPGGRRAFDVYSELRQLLTVRGLDADRVAFIHDAGNDTTKARLFERCRDGDVDVIVGSTDKMGVGTNIQDRLIALHHVDAPWRPADIEQRDGRGIRQGNQNPQIHVIRYVTEASFDPYMYQTLERKSRFISQVTHSAQIDPTMRSVDDLDSEVVLSYAELKAISTGNPLIQRHAETVGEHARLARLATNHAKTQRQLPARIASLDRQIVAVDERIERLGVLDTARVRTRAHEFSYTTPTGEHIAERRVAGEALRDTLVALRGSGDWAPVGVLGGLAHTARYRALADSTGFDIAIAGHDTSVTYSTARLWDTQPHALMITLERRIEQLPVELAELETRRTDFVEQRSRASELIGVVFVHRDELETVAATIAELEVEMRQLDKPATPTPPGPSSPPTQPPERNAGAFVGNTESSFGFEGPPDPGPDVGGIEL